MFTKMVQKNQSHMYQNHYQVQSEIICRSKKEALGLIFGVNYFLYGRNFLLMTDHKPLLTIFGISTATANRLQQWAIILASYTYDIQYKPTGKRGNADTPSRLPVSDDQHLEQDYI